MAMNGLAFAAQPAAEAASTQHQLVAFDIAAQPLDRAALAFAEQAGVQVFFDSARLQDLASTPLKGRYSLDEGLRRLLGSAPVDYRFDGAQQVTLIRRGVGAEQALQLQPTNVQSQWLSERQETYLKPRSVAVIDREQIDRRPPRHAADMLEETSGVYTAVNQRDPGLSVNIRGVQDYGRVNMNVDGMRQNFSVNGHQQRNGVMFVDPEFISSVEIYKGTSAGMGGAGVLGGIASFNSVEAREFLGEGKEYGGRLRGGHGIGELGNGTYFNGSALFAFGNEIGDVLLGVSERHFGDYRAGTQDKDNLGSEIRIRTIAPRAWEDWLESEVGEMDSVTRSRLFKLGLNLPTDQRLQLSYMEYDTDSKDAWAYIADDNQSTYYRRQGTSDVIARNTALDYSYSPDNDLIDFKAKLYYVSTRQDRWNAGSAASPGSGNWYPDYSDKYRTDTWGLQLQNTSRFYLGDAHQFAFTYGSELFRDSFKPSTARTPSTNETAYPYIKGATPEGERTLASLFGQVIYDYEQWLTLDAGLRYDRYRLEGDTGLTGWMLPEGQFTASNNVERSLVYDVDREEGRFSPTLGLAIKPGVDWLQLYTRWGKGWRPPAVTEAFMSGRPHGGGNEMVYPNPFLEAERSYNWEAGFNVFKESLLRDGDRLGIKVAYFDTRIDDFSFMDINVSVPGATVGGTALGRSAYQNNLKQTRFRGVEYNLDYDAGDYYAQLSYTHMIGSNEFCSKDFYLGGAQKRVQVGTVTTFIRVGTRLIPVRRPLYEAQPNEALNEQVSCNHIMGNAAYMPADRGSLTLGMRFLDRRLDLGARLRYSAGNGENLDNHSYSQIDQALWPQYKVYDLYASYWMTSSLNLALSMENVTDQAYFVAMGDANNLSLARGRTLTGMLEYRF
ncbi:TonB-dependent hemoglobin/transferrin/lactoferrin family receptor [Pseudomonas sp. GOM7]|uniref:TonB-dependent receptor n=1 Tax=Pseudomonas sp. GOM7 TaxID=2998079 RepID=UPI00227A8F82|nr:TonB-dependent receptor [Pseudomonas sp. GOM7]WAJ40114.1 TonB-dependent hemoglobin/transferrin/lactoferrin family receptor [Pseudomonas sp. GOM7]